MGAALPLMVNLMIAIAVAFGWSTFEGAFFGAILAASSSMVILKTFLDRSEIGSSHGRPLLSMSIVQDLQVVVMVAVLLKVGLALSFIAGGAWVGLRYLPRLIVVALPDVASSREAVRIAREMNPRAAIVARARNEQNVQELLGAGASKVMVPELAGAQALLRASLDSLAMPY